MLSKAGFTLVGSIFLALAAAGFYFYFTSSGPALLGNKSLRDACRRLVVEARNEATPIADRRAQEFAAFITERASGARAFAEDMTSLYAKWRLVKSWLPLADDDGHRRYIEEAFARHLFSNDELKAAMQRSIEFALRDLDQTENKLAVDLRREILGWSHAHADLKTTQAQYEQALAEMLKSARWDAEKSIGGLVLSEIASQVATQLATRLGVSAGLLGAGAASSWYTYGATFVAGLIVDEIIEWIDDPVGDIERELRAHLDKLAREGREVIQAELNKVIEARTSGWSKFVEEHIQ